MASFNDAKIDEWSKYDIDRNSKLPDHYRIYYSPDNLTDKEANGVLSRHLAYSGHWVNSVRVEKPTSKSRLAPNGNGTIIIAILGYSPS